MKLKKGDQVQILLGKDRGRQGKILQVLGKDAKVVVEGINTFKKHVRKMGEIEGGIINITKPVNLSNVALVCPNCKKTTRVGFEINNDIKTRICKKCKKEVK